MISVDLCCFFVSAGNQHVTVYSSEAGVVLDDLCGEQRSIATVLAAAWYLLLQLSHIVLFNDKTTQHQRR